jgi:HEAT repeat protein
MTRHEIRCGCSLLKRCGILMLAALIVAATFVSSFGGAEKGQSSNSLTPLQLEIEKQRQRLSSTEVEERRDALMRLGALNRAEASRVAISALADPAPIVRATAVYALAALPAAESVTALIPLLSDKDEFLRQQVCYALGVTRSRTAVTPLVERLNLDKFDSVRAAAAVALGRIGDESAVVPLVEVLAGKSLAAAVAKKRKAETNEFILRAAAHALGEIGSRAGVPVLIEVLLNDSMAADVRREAAVALGLIKDPSALPALRSVLTARDPYLSGAAHEALRRIEALPISS